MLATEKNKLLSSSLFFPVSEAYFVHYFFSKKCFAFCPFYLFNFILYHLKMSTKVYNKVQSKDLIIITLQLNNVKAVI